MCNDSGLSGIACLCLVLHCSGLVWFHTKALDWKPLQKNDYRFAPICESRPTDRKGTKITLFAHPFKVRKNAQNDPIGFGKTSETNITHHSSALSVCLPAFYSTFRTISEPQKLKTNKSLRCTIAH